MFSVDSIADRPFSVYSGKGRLLFIQKSFEGEKELHKQGALREFGHYAAMNILGMIGISCYILADTYFVAQGLGSLGLAALNIAIPAYNLMNGIGLMLGVGAATQYTIARAQNDRRQADSVFTHAAALGLLLGLLFLLGGLCFCKTARGSARRGTRRRSA